MAIIDLPLEKLKKYKPKFTREKDFDKFWKDTKAESKRQPLNVEMKKVHYPVNRLEVFKIFYDGFKGGRICGILMREKGAKNSPGMLAVHGYSGSKGVVADYLGWVFQGYTVLALDVRGQAGESGDAAKYSGGHIWGWMTQGILNPYEYYYRLVYMDCVRGLDILYNRKEVDKKRIVVTGGSQGGGLTLAVCGLDDRPKLGVSAMPFMCHFRRAVEISPQRPYTELMDYMKFYPDKEDQVYRTLSYIDNLNLADKIKCKMFVSVGLQDLICPPSTVFAVYNNMKCKKHIQVYNYAGHDFIGVHNDDRIKWLAENL